MPSNCILCLFQNKTEKITIPIQNRKLTINIYKKFSFALNKIILFHFFIILFYSFVFFQQKKKDIVYQWDYYWPLLKAPLVVVSLCFVKFKSKGLLLCNTSYFTI